MKVHAILALFNVGLAIVISGCGSQDEKYKAYEITPQESLTEDETQALGTGCTRLVQDLGTFSTKDDCSTHLAGIPQISGKNYQCVKKTKSVGCK